MCLRRWWFEWHEELTIKKFLDIIGQDMWQVSVICWRKFFLTIEHKREGVVNFRTLFLFLYSIYSILCYKLPLFFEGGWGRETSRRAKLFHILCSVSSISRAVSSNSMYVVMCGEFRASPIVLCFLFYTALHVSVWYIRVGLIREL